MTRQAGHSNGRGTATDAVGVQLFAGCDGVPTVCDLLAVWDSAHGFAPAAALPAVRHLVERGVLLPVMTATDRTR